jgi:hypothetical protein
LAVARRRSGGDGRRVGHANTNTTEKVYRKELRSVLTRGAAAMDDLFNDVEPTHEPGTTESPSPEPPR